MVEKEIIREIDWGIDPKEMQLLSDRVLEEANRELDDLARTPADKTSIETLERFEEIRSSVEEKLGPLAFLKDVSTDKEQRDAGHIIEQDAMKFMNGVWSRNDIYSVISRLENMNISQDEQEQMLLKHVLEDFRLRGAALGEDARMEFLEIANNISVRESDFTRVLNEVTDKVRCTEEELEGVPKEIYQDLEREVDAYLLPLDRPVVSAVLRYAKKPETRKRMATANYMKGGMENSDRLIDTLALRDRQAKLLGQIDYASYVMSRRMAKSSERVLDFISELRSKLHLRGREDLERMRVMKSKELGISLDEDNLMDWDLLYYHDMLMREQYSVDQNEVKEYFPTESVIEGVMDLYQKVLMLDFQEMKPPESWCQDVRRFRVIDSVDGSVLGVLYLDLYPREGKFKHMAAFPILERRIVNGTCYVPIASLVANFQKPSKSQPSLLTHDDVVGLFHEFGHLMHIMSNKTKYAYFAVKGIPWDFIEVPSMMFQNWAWKEDVLAVISGHYKDRTRKLPPETLRRIIDAKLLDVGILHLRQISYALIDMKYHTAKIEDTTSTFIKIFTDITGLRMPDGINPDAGFAHVMGGYAAGYYSYLWSQAIAEDLFTKFDANGFMDEKTGLEYRQKILAPQGSRDPNDMVRDFLGRETNNKAFLKSLGI